MEVGPVTVGGEVRKHACNVVHAELVELPEGVTPGDALDSYLDFERRSTRDRAVIDQSAEALEHVLLNESLESAVDITARVREIMYERYEVPDDAQEVTRGTPDH